MFEARLPALAGPQIFLGPGSPLQPGPKFMRPSAPLSLSLKSAAGRHLRPGAPLSPGPKSSEARRPAVAGPQVFGVMRPGSPLSPGPTSL